MSTINKIPSISPTLSRMSLDELNTLLGLINGGDNEPTFITLDSRTGDHVLSSDDKGISYVALRMKEVRAQMTYYGYLIYNDTDCVLIYFTGEKHQNIGLIIINPTTFEVLFVNEPMTIMDLRSEVGDYLVEQGGGTAFVELGSSAAGTLTEAQLALVKQANCVVGVYNVQKCYKSSQNAGYVFYKSYPLTSSGVTYFYEVQIALTDGSYTISQKIIGIEIGDVINLGQMYIIMDEEGGTPEYHATFVASPTPALEAAIPEQGLAIIMFNQTSILVPFAYKLSPDLGGVRFVANVIYNASGDSMVARAKMSYVGDSGLSIEFDANTAKALYESGMTAPYGIIRFIKL